MEQPHFNIVLIEPEIPNNTGSIGRTCVGTNSRLHLVGKLGFEIDDKAVRRAGLDYWEHLDLAQYDSVEQWFEQVPDKSRVFFFSKKASKTFYEERFKKGYWRVFGKETVGLDPKLLREFEDQCLRIPMWGPIRSLNQANAVTAVVYEGLRQIIAK
ncbi:MAG: tRNA (cytidine(34)-2'-O)-methyltransferase [Oligoflexia bacterium]|nr:tRNA (cytidine(34)-2'-O)-methyltransferase [Oligoflexia bacterium]